MLSESSWLNQLQRYVYFSHDQPCSAVSSKNKDLLGISRPSILKIKHLCACFPCEEPLSPTVCGQNPQDSSTPRKVPQFYVRGA